MSSFRQGDTVVFVVTAEGAFAGASAKAILHGQGSEVVKTDGEGIVVAANTLTTTFSDADTKDLEPGTYLLEVKAKLGGVVWTAREELVQVLASKIKEAVVDA